MKRVIIPAIILIVILAIWYVQNKMESRQMSARTIDNFLGLDPAEINKVTVKTARDTLTFTMENGRWMLQGQMPRLTDSMAVENMISTAAGIKVGSVISENPERQKDFMVDSVSGNLIRFYSGDRLLNAIIVGKMTPDYTHTYLRKPGSNEVFEGMGMLTYVFSRARNQWLNRTIFAFNPNSVRQVELDYPDKAYRLNFSGSKWYIAKKPYRDSVQADSIKVVTYLARVSNFDGSDFADITDTGKVNFDRISLSLKITLEGETAPHVVDFADTIPDFSRFYCRVPGREDTLVVYKSTYESIKKQFADFLP
jgi:Domain of unknown function (DUF4340)